MNHCATVPSRNDSSTLSRETCMRSDRAICVAMPRYMRRLAKKAVSNLESRRHCRRGCSRTSLVHVVLLQGVETSEASVRYQAVTQLATFLYLSEILFMAIARPLRGYACQVLCRRLSRVISNSYPAGRDSRISHKHPR